MNKDRISININYNDNLFHQLISAIEGNTYHWFKCKMEDGSEIDLVEKKDYDLLQQKNNQLKDNWNKLKKELWYLRDITFTKKFGNEWNNCLSFNDDIKPILETMQELEKGNSNE